MEVLTFSDLRANLEGVMDRVVDDKTQVVVSRQRGEAVLMMSLSEWNAVEETMHLLSTPANAQHLRASIAQLNAGSGDERELINP